MNSIFDLMDENIKQLNDIKVKLHDHKEENMAINIIIDDSDAQNPIFVEIENDDGESIGVGSVEITDEGYRKIRISTYDIISHVDIMHHNPI